MAATLRVSLGSVLAEFDNELAEARLARPAQPSQPSQGAFCPVAQISYSQDFSDVSVLLAWALAMQPPEYSPRMLRLTEVAIDCNLADYSAWELRRDVLVGLTGAAPRISHSELDFNTHAISKTTKNYQVWHHRRFLVRSACLSSLDQEMRFTGSLIQGDDAKNIFVWGHRIFCASLWGEYNDKELSFAETVIEDDLRNHSAWNYRNFIATRCGLRNNAALQKSELAFGMKYAELAAHSESSWSYLRSVAEIADHAGHSLWADVREFAQDISENISTSTHAQSVLMEAFEKTGDYSKAIQCCRQLAAIDPIRKSYWNSRCERLSERQSGAHIR